MNTHDVSAWPARELRLAFYDFSRRGEGDSRVVAAVIGEWRERGALSAESAAYWLDALEWRGLGRLLPGWAAPPETVEQPAVEADLREFEDWRAGAPRQQAA